jgi:hypothetical protein
LRRKYSEPELALRRTDRRVNVLAVAGDAGVGMSKATATVVATPGE